MQTQFYTLDRGGITWIAMQEGSSEQRENEYKNKRWTKRLPESYLELEPGASVDVSSALTDPHARSRRGRTRTQPCWCPAGEKLEG